MEQKNTMHGSPEVSSILDLINAVEPDTDLKSWYFRAGGWINERVKKINDRIKKIIDRIKKKNDQIKEKQEPSKTEILDILLIIKVLKSTAKQYGIFFGDKREVTGFYKKRPLELMRLLRNAQFLESRLRHRNTITLLIGVGFICLIVGLPLIALTRYGWHDETMRESANLFQAMEAIVTVVGAFITASVFLWYREKKIRVGIAVKQLQKCSIFIHIVDAHVLSKNFAPHWHFPPAPNSVGGVHPADQELYKDVNNALHYLTTASAFARYAGRVAGLYAQWIPEPEVIRVSDMIFQLALDLERNLLLKSQLIRTFATTPQNEAHAVMT